MKKKFVTSILSFLLAFTMLPQAAFAAEVADSAQLAEETQTAPEDLTWDLASDTTAVRPLIEGTTGEFEGIIIDATNGKFAPRTPETGGNDTQINAGTVLTIPVSANSSGATLTINLSGGTGTVEINGQSYTDISKTIAVDLPASDSETAYNICFTVAPDGSNSTYVSSISLSYNKPEPEYPGTPESATAEDIAYTFESAENLLDETGNIAADNKLEGNRGSFYDMKIDATAGKFNIQPDQTRVVINAGTVIYIPAAYDTEGAVLLIAGTTDGSTPSEIKVNGQAFQSNAEIPLDMNDESAYPQYLKVEFDTICYANTISLNYASDSDYGTPEIEARDKSWDFTETSPVERPTVQGAKGEFDGIQIDATTGKFAPRTSSGGGNDTQIGAGTTLYIPIAPDEQGASITVSGNNYNNLTVLLDETEISVGKETALPSVESNAYIPLSFTSPDGTGSCYLTGITIDYMSDNVVNTNVVTVGKDQSCDYGAIQEALDTNDSSASAPLVLLIAPGTYTEKITVDKPWVSFQPMYRDGGKIIIEESYYSSNTFNADGTYNPQDDYDLGTDQCGTVLLTANATGFSASGITFQNSYNVVDHTGKGEQTPAVAFGSATDKVYLKDCRFIGRQDTLYLHGAGSRVKVENCYIEGTVDFVFGDADVYFLNCELHMAGFSGRDTGYFTAANTKKGNVGFVFDQCTLTADSSYGEGSTVSLGRPWQTECYTETARDENGNSYMTVYEPDRKNPSYESTSSAVTFIECTMTSVIQSERWNVWTRKDKDGVTQDVTYHEDVRFAEINSKDTSGAYLQSENYPDIVLGTMSVTDNAQDQIDNLLGQMGFGGEIGYWNPSLDDHSGTKPEITLPFTDVSADAWYHEAVTYTYEHKLMAGLTNSIFAPDDILTRAQFAVILYRINGEPEVSYDAVFPDVPDKEWFTNAVLWASSNGIVSGYGDTGLFGPNDNITREQMAIMMYRYAVYKDYDVEASADLSEYQDSSEVSDFAETAMQWAAGSGMITGKDNGTLLDPQGNTTRAECAVIIKSFTENYGLE